MTRQDIAAARLALFITLITPVCAPKFGQAVRLLVRLRAEEESHGHVD